MSRLFTARYGGRCDACGDGFEEGDGIGYVEDYDRPVCESCWAAAGGDGEFRPTVLMHRVSEALGRAAEPLTQRGVLDRVTGKRDSICAALARLVDEGYVLVVDGARGARLHTLAKPFDEEAQ